MPHPDHLFGALTARQLLDWWWYWCDEPWGDERADLRELAAIAVAHGISEMTLQWPYHEPEPTPEELLDELERLEAELT